MLCHELGDVILVVYPETAFVGREQHVFWEPVASVVDPAGLDTSQTWTTRSRDEPRWSDRASGEIYNSPIVPGNASL